MDKMFVSKKEITYTDSAAKSKIRIFFTTRRLLENIHHVVLVCLDSAYKLN